MPSSALHAEAGFFQALVDQANLPLFVVRPAEDFRLIYVNDAACLYFGRSREELSTMRIIDLDPGATPEGCVRFWQRLEQEKLVSFRAQYRQKNGFVLPIVLTATHVTYEGEGLILTEVRDANEGDAARRDREALEAEMREAQRMQSLATMAAGVAHDFNNLLTGILGNVVYASELVTSTPEAREPLEEAEAAARKAAELCEQLLAYAGGGRPVVEPVELGAFVRASTPLLTSSISRRAKLELELGPGSLVIEAQPIQLRQLVVNLVRNASEALGIKGGTITLRTGGGMVDATALSRLRTAPDVRPGPFNFIEVEDQGPGFPRDLVGRAFDPFVTTKDAGRGLGLAAVLGIVRGHLGAIELESRPGKGARLRAWFPASDRREALEKLLASTRRRGLVLVVDDEPAVRRVAQRLLVHAGFEVETAEDGPSALERVASTPAIVCVLMDVTMPGMDGREALTKVRALRPDLPVVLMSGYEAAMAQAARGEDTSHVPFVPKPFHPTVLVQTIERALAAHDAASDARSK